jgi:hypothetical protein
MTEHEREIIHKLAVGWGRKGGTARKQALTAEQRREIAARSSQARWDRYRELKAAGTEPKIVRRWRRKPVQGVLIEST